MGTKPEKDQASIVSDNEIEPRDAAQTETTTEGLLALWLDTPDVTFGVDSLNEQLMSSSAALATAVENNRLVLARTADRISRINDLLQSASTATYVTNNRANGR